jgi:hypothetical protein
MVEAYPLQWPQGYRRTPFRKSAKFKCTFAQARDGIIHELKLLRAGRVVISTNVPLRQDGMPYAGLANPKDPGAAVYFYYQNRQLVLACDRWANVTDNLRAIEKAVEAMRGLDRWGVSDMLDRAFTGFTALPPPPEQTSKKYWWQVLEVTSDVPLHIIEDRYRQLAKSFHPDASHGGNPEKMTELNQAIREARRARGVG